ncbi:MAG: hypothetical protein EBU13_10765, partial [Synechococcaceae bacterium WB5_2A_257]|nr:hypothetical protein [Synechococcaceae bacterium WB5_2A_257]
QATQFSTTTKLTGQVRFVMGDVYRGDGYANFGQFSALRDAAKLYGQRAYDGSTGGFEDRSTNMIADPLSQGEAYYYYRAGGNGTPAGLPAATYQPTKIFAAEARQLAFSTSWNGYTPSGTAKTSLFNTTVTNAFGAGSSVMSGAGTGSQMLVNTNIPGTTIANPLNGNAIGATTTVPYVANRERLSIYTEDGFQTSVKLPTSPTGNPSTIANATLEYLLPNSSTALPLTGNEILLNDRYGRTNTLRVKTSGSTSSNFVETKILLDRKDTQALVQLANEARRAKAYIYTNRDGVSVSKIAGQYDIININDTASRTYTAVNAIGTTVTNFGASGSGLVVTPGGYVTNPTIYNNVINYLIAEYGSLSETQRKYGFVQNSANKF